MTNLSDVRQVAPLAALSHSAGFRPLARFGQRASSEPLSDDADPQAELIAQAHAQGFAEGRAEAEAEAQATLAAHGQLSLAFQRLDQAMEEELRLVLHETVARLCEGVLAPLALDEAALMARIDKAVAMLARAYDERTIRLNPEDMALLSDQLDAEWSVQPDPSLPRGTLRVESSEGGVEDGPETWRRAISDALGPC